MVFKKDIVTNANEVKKMIAKALWEAGCTSAGIAGVLGNIQAESAYQSKNLQNTYEKKLGLSDDQYVDEVDVGGYTNFVRDSAGFGLAQWTYWSRKQALYDYCRNKNASIGDTETQVEFLVQELMGYKQVWQVITTTTSVYEAASVVLKQYERPADMSDAVCQKRATMGEQALQTIDFDQPKNQEKDWKKMYDDLMDTLELIVKNREH